MKRTVAAIATAVCLGVGAVGCSSAHKPDAAPSHTTASIGPTASSSAAPAAPASCDAGALKQVTQQMNTPDMRSSLSASGVTVTQITSDNTCDLVLMTTGAPHAQDQALPVLEQALKDDAPPAGDGINGWVIEAQGGCVLFSTDPRQDAGPMCSAPSTMSV
ncbi:hypothetical protein NGB36_16875 [Streptomyces sp. RB6PN25]|uniref:Lipoprotein n=1 Tax=Streptomyces humicola TaxID=2953240 RepID=A0ABT1PX33_9ACTN|nr:hypothetical protein [Streptomyces humicola]MCQ4082234.1 hypothetical protein [Streptomyces humicola]